LQITFRILFFLTVSSRFKTLIIYVLLFQGQLIQTVMIKLVMYCAILS